MSCSVCQGYSSDKCPVCNEGVRSVECPDCHGTGKTPWLAWNMNECRIEEVTKETWMTLPEDEEEADLLTIRGKRQRYCRYEEGGYVCRTCNGDGRLPEDY